MNYSYIPKGVCSREITFDLEGDIVKNVYFEGGCPGTHTGISRACEGKSVDEIVEMFEGIPCGFKPTSCPDQLAKALKEAYEKSQSKEK